MKFKAILTDYGVALLERRFVPAFEKIGKTCHVYLTRVHITLLHNVLNADGVQAVAQFSRVLHTTPLFVITLLCFSAKLCLLPQI
jgi:HUS1 checkpoint protein